MKKFQPLRFMDSNPDRCKAVVDCLLRHGFTCTDDQAQEMAGNVRAAGFVIDGDTDELWQAMQEFIAKDA